MVILVIVFFRGALNFFQSKDEFDGSIMLPYGTKIVAFGDSITYGYNVPRDKSYPAQLANLLQVEVINEGINGELSSEGLKRLPNVLDKHKPNILIICEGGNDIIQKKSLFKAKENIKRMIKITREKGVFVVIVGVPTVDILTLSTAEFYYEIAKEMDVPLEDEALEKILNDPNLKIDYIHPNEKGYEILSNNLANLIISTYVPSDLSE